MLSFEFIDGTFRKEVSCVTSRRERSSDLYVHENKCILRFNRNILWFSYIDERNTMILQFRVLNHNKLQFRTWRPSAMSQHVAFGFRYINCNITHNIYIAMLLFFKMMKQGQLQLSKLQSKIAPKLLWIQKLQIWI